MTAAPIITGPADGVLHHQRPDIAAMVAQARALAEAQAAPAHWLLVFADWAAECAGWLRLSDDASATSWAALADAMRAEAAALPKAPPP
jgi:hypothetical protein